LDDDLLDLAGELGGSTLRSLDAIHLAAAQAIGADLVEVITYDRRMAQAAAALGLPLAAPATDYGLVQTATPVAGEAARVPRSPKAGRQR
jgi:hypothetical protein